MIRRVEHGDMRDVLAKLKAEGVRVASIVTDPPYHLTASRRAAVRPSGSEIMSGTSRGFMGKTWDGGDVAFDPETWRLCYDLLPPGGHILSFGGTRTYHRMACAIEDAGFEIRDMTAWLYGSGFPKSHNVSKGIDKARDDSAAIVRVTAFMLAAAEARGIGRADVDAHMGTSDMGGWWLTTLRHRCQCPKWDQWLKLKAFLGLTDEMDAEVWRLNGRKGTPGEAWGERAIVGQSSNGIAGGTGRHVGTEAAYGFAADYDLTAPATDAARQWEGWGTALKPALEPIYLARKPLVGTVAANVQAHGTGALNIDGCRAATDETITNHARGADAAISKGIYGDSKGQQTHQTNGQALGRWPANVVHDGSDEVVKAFPDSGGGHHPATRGAGGIGNDGHKGQAGLAERFDAAAGSAARFFYSAKADAGDRLGSKHPTVKPVDLMRWLVRLITPPGGLVLDPFAGSGTTAMACLAEGFPFIMVEREAEHVEDIRRRLAHVRGDDTPLFAGQS